MDKTTILVCFCSCHFLVATDVDFFLLQLSFLSFLYVISSWYGSFGLYLVPTDAFSCRVLFYLSFSMVQQLLFWSFFLVGIDVSEVVTFFFAVKIVLLVIFFVLIAFCHFHCVIVSLVGSVGISVCLPFNVVCL